MSAVGRARGTLDTVVDRLPIVDRGSHAAVWAIAIVGLLARLVALGARPAHYDEGRVAYWALHFLESGEIHYRFAVHGPLLQYVDAFVFGLLGPTDFAMRLVVALIGACLPLAILLFREHLRDEELVAGALFLAFNPVLLYYSRFYRGTIPLVTFTLVAFGLFVRYGDTRRIRYVHAGVVFVALAFATKESAIVYLVVWIGASVVVLCLPILWGDWGAIRGRVASSWERVRPRDWQAAGPRLGGHVLLALGLFLAVFLFFYAPRAGSAGGVGLWRSLGSGDVLPLLQETWADVERGFGYWLGGGTRTGEVYDSLLDRYVTFLQSFLEVVVGYAPALVAATILGLVVELRRRHEARWLVVFTGAWGVASLVGYPLGTDITSAWVTANALVPLVVPAAVGVGVVYRWGLEAFADDDWVSVGIVALLVVLVVGQVGLTVTTDVYLDPQGETNGLVQYGQSADDLRPTFEDVEALAEANDGVDVVFYGELLLGADGSAIYPACTDIGETLPIQWYLARADASATCAASPADFERHLDDSPPPVVITTPENAPEVGERLPEYDRRVRRVWQTGGERVFFLDADRLPETEG